MAKKRKKRSKKSRKKGRKKAAKRKAKGQVPLRILEKRLGKLSRIVKARGGSVK